MDDYDEDPLETEPVVTTLNESIETEEDVAEANLLAEVEGGIEGDNAPGQEGDDQSDPVVDPVTTEAECATLSVKQLKQQMKMRRVGRQGKTRKADLCAILQEAIRNNVPVYAENANADGEEVPEIEDGFNRSAKWRTLEALEEVIEDPTADGFRPPTQPVEQTDKVNERHNFAEVFDRPCFKEMSPEWRLTRSKKNSRVVMDGRRKPRYFSTLREKGRAKVSWL